MVIVYFNNNDCLLINKYSSCILHIKNDGKIQETCDYIQDHIMQLYSEEIH